MQYYHYVDVNEAREKVLSKPASVSAGKQTFTKVGDAAFIQIDGFFRTASSPPTQFLDTAGEGIDSFYMNACDVPLEKPAVPLTGKADFSEFFNTERLNNLTDAHYEAKNG